MEVNDFAKYVLNNIARATLGNALKISDKLDNTEYYSFKDFIKCFEESVTEALQAQKIDIQKCYALLTLTSNAAKMYDAQINYSKIFIINDFIINVWRVMNGY